MDEPCSALDPIATQQVEELIFELKKDYTIVIVTHNMQQAARVSDYTGFFDRGELIEFGETERIFTKPAQRAHRSLHHREIRMSLDVHRHFHDELSHVKVRLLTMSGEAEAALGLAVEALLERDERQGPARHRRRPGHRQHGGRDRGAVHQPPRPPAADGARPPDAHLGAQDRQRPRAGGRPRRQHRPERRAADRRPGPIAPGARDRRDGAAGARHAVRRARGLHPGRRRRRPRGLPAGRQGGRAAPLGVPHPAHAHDGGPAHDRRRHGALPGEPEPRAGGRPRHQHRRGRGLPGRGQVDQAPRRGPRRGARPACIRPPRARDRPHRPPSPPPTRRPPATASPPSTSAPTRSGCWSRSTIPPPASPIIDEVKDQPRLAAGPRRHRLPRRARPWSARIADPGAACARSASAAASSGSRPWPPRPCARRRTAPWFVRRVRQELGHPAPDHRRRDRGGALLPLGGAPLPAGRRAHPRGRHRRRQPRADRRGGRPGRARPSRSRSARCGSPSCTCPASAPRTRRSSSSGATSGSSSSAASPAGSGPRPRSSAPAAPSPTSAAWCRPGAASPPGDTVHGVSVTDRRGRAAASTGSPAGRRSSGAQVPGLNPAAGRHHPRRPRGDGRAARLVRSRVAHGERVRPARGAAAGDGRRQGDRRAAIRSALFREFAERCQCDRRHVEQVRYLALQLFDQLGERARLRARGAAAARGRGAAARRRPAGELPQAPQAQLPAHHARRAAGPRPARARRWWR